LRFDEKENFKGTVPCGWSWALEVLSRIGLRWERKGKRGRYFEGLCYYDPFWRFGINLV